MLTREDIGWFKEQFAQQIGKAIKASPFTVDMLTAIACQETGFIWSSLRKKGLPVREILGLCVGDVIDGRPDGKGRRAFPRTRTDLLTRNRGAEMFALGREALINMSAHIPGYSTAARNPNKFCRGYGIFQYDLQHFLADPDYFLERKYERFEDALGKCIEQLDAARRRVGHDGRSQLNDVELAAVAIAYNCGRYDRRKGLLQGHFDGARYYGQLFMDYLRLAKTVPDPQSAPAIPEPPAGQAILAPPSAPPSSGRRYVVDTQTSDLRVRSEPRIEPRRPRTNVVADLPDGHPVRVVSAVPVNGFIEVETSLRGALVHGFASERFLRPVRATPPASPLPATSLVGEARLTRRRGLISRRAEPADAHSLNEPRQPGRRGTTPEELRSELTTIIDWLGVDNPRHKRYLGGSGRTFCNIYAHDYCALAGVYLPRVWWNGHALERLGAGQRVQPIYGTTVDEMRANDLFRWLRDFGQRFGWRQTGTLTKLQNEANIGAVALIVARQRIDGRSGHIVVVAPETAVQSARRNAAGDVVAPVQSQAGASNFRYGLGRAEWWRGPEFAEFAFWVHA